MCKTIKKSFTLKLTFDNLMNAYERASKNKGNKKDLLKFNIDLETNIINILNDLKKGTYKQGKYRTFTIYEPKERIIKSLPFRDRIVQQWYIEEFIKPFILPRFIYSNCACIEFKGTLFSVNTTQKYMRKMKKLYGDYYVLKCDIKKYFYNIDKDILFNIMKKYISDKKLLELTKVFIYEDDLDIGIPIGNYTSQYFANIYLNELDKYIKEKLKIKYYIRYMDDFIILLKTKEECKEIKKNVEKFLSDKLKLELNIKSKYYPSKMGINFCGYVIYETHKLIRKRSKYKLKRNISSWNYQYLLDNLDIRKFILSWNSFIGYFKHANSYNFRLKMFNSLFYTNDKMKL